MLTILGIMYSYTAKVGEPSLPNQIFSRYDLELHYLFCYLSIFMHEKKSVNGVKSVRKIFILYITHILFLFTGSNA